MSTVPHAVENMADAAQATAMEHQMTLKQAFTVYRKAALWSLALGTCIIMEGFDLILIGSLFGYPAFQRKFGQLQPNGTYELTAAWQSGLSNGTLCGQIVGLFAAGLLCDRFGFRKTMGGGIAMITAFIFFPVFAPTIEILLVGQVLLGIPFGVFQTLACTYAAEVCPTTLRAYLTTYTNLCWVIGQILSSGVLRGLLSRTDDWGYKIPFALQWFWPIPIAVFLSFAPESPYWYVRKGRIEDAKRSLQRLTDKSSMPEFDSDQVVAMMVYTNNMEKAASEGTTYWDCFKGTDLRRTEIVCVVWAIQTLCGSTFMGTSSYFYQQAGLDVSNAFTMTLVQFCLGGLGTVFSWALMGWFGRRTLYLGGQLIMCALLAIIGFLALIDRSNTNAQWAIGSMLLVYTFVYDCTVGPVCYALVTELTSTRLKVKTVVLARNLYNVTGIATNILTPLMLNPTAWNWGAKAGFFWAGSCALCALWTFFRLPEPKGRTYGELDVLFEGKVGARKFKTAEVDEFPSTSTLNLEKVSSDVSGKAEGNANVHVETV
ncbi:general substrate transporter [Microdochium trichocladiopsis]|uniref:General substrate transporter n=1 Tax=Microdochium trichocladiopsis TaxID=1682393 RepID=A0A9P8YFV6_9PEZI|nr:general substrate transporter [Microdochium trichocladiopsis]KAH7039619.1 general substrate transporter [Microdochium trichocladiopsis]